MNHSVFLFLLSFIACLGSFASDINAPSIMAISDGLATTVDHVQLSMTMFIFGLAFSQLIYGPLTDSVGRKKPLSVGIIIFIIGSFIASYSHNIVTLVAARTIQGMGAGATACIWRALFVDRFSQAEIVIYASYLQLIMLFIIPTGSFLGGMLDSWFSWRASFLFMGVYGSCSVLMVQGVSEKPIANPLPITLTSIISRYKDIITHPVFIKYMFCAAAGYGAFFSWYIIGPVLTKLSPADFGTINFCISLPSIFISSQINRRFVKKVGSEILIRAGFLSLIMGAGVIILSEMMKLPMVLFVAYFFIMTGVMVALANTFSCAFQPFERTAGSAAGLYGGLQQLGAVITGAVLSLMPESSSYPFAITVLIIAISGLLVLKPTEE